MGIEKMELQEIKLNTGQEYRVREFPRRNLHTATYIGEDNVNHIFVNELRYFLFDKDSLRLVSIGSYPYPREIQEVTHHYASNFQVVSIKRNKLKAYARLIDRLKDIGEEI